MTGSTAAYTFNKLVKGVTGLQDYSKDEFERMIAYYQNELMTQYPTSPNRSQSNVDTNEEKPDNTSEAVDVSVPEEPPSRPSDLTDIGQLQVRVSTENQAIPLPGSVITITYTQDGETNLIRTVIADENGLTPLMDLPTKDRALSMTPGNPTPFATYTVDVTTDGYFPKRFVNLPIYGGVVAVQNVSMIPLPEQGDNDRVLQYNQESPTL